MMKTPLDIHSCGVFVYMKVLSFALVGNMPTFPNLINLELEMESYDCVQLLRHFLMNSPNLQSLTLKLVSFNFQFSCYFSSNIICCDVYFGTLTLQSILY